MVDFHQIQEDVATIIGWEEMFTEAGEPGLGPVQELGPSVESSNRSTRARACNQRPNQAPAWTKDFDMTQS